MYPSAATQAYAKVGLESGALTADPHKLISMLFQGALLAIANAKNGMLRKDIPAKGAAISKAILIIGEGLQDSLDKNVGGELAQSLDALYGYMCARLVHANAHNDLAVLDEISGLLNELKDAWDTIRPQAINTQPTQAAQPAKKQEALVYGRA
ncbi:MAG: flagellar export chaperone FliS [Sideroxydans sp.]|nr:flagellar export chaperone FliS [Sideroxydans sp.]